MAGEGRHRRGGWITLLILALIVALPGYALLTGTGLVIVTNEVGSDANVTVFHGAQPVGASRIAAGDSAWYIFTPHTEENFAIGCRVDSLAENRIAHVHYTRARVFRITIGPCGRIKRHGTSSLF